VAEEEASEKALTIIAKIKAKQWKAMGKTVEQMKEFADSGGLEGFVGDLQETLSLQVQDALAPLKNEVNEAVMNALAPIMPQIVEFLAGVTDFLVVGIGGLEALLTGNWDTWIDKQIRKFQKDLESLNPLLREAHDNIQKWRYMWEHGRGGEAIAAGWEGFWTDVGAGWEGFWRDVGWR